jgi:hypothetical protein
MLLMQRVITLVQMDLQLMQKDLIPRQLETDLMLKENILKQGVIINMSKGNII